MFNPLPSPASNDRCAVPDDCDMIYWDPIGCKCTCTGPTCASYKDNSRAIQLNPADVDKNVPGVGGNGSKNSAFSPFTSFYGEILAALTAILTL